MPVYNDGHFSLAALESTKQVELALKEKTEINEKLFGARLIDQVFGSGKSIKLKIPLGDDLQQQGKSLFKGAFSYYRNYAAHDGSRINEMICIRIMVIASELLDLIDASSISFKEIGGINGLIEKGIFDEKSQISDLLSFLSRQVLPHEIFDGMAEDLAEKGYTHKQYQAVLDLGLIEYKNESKNHNLPDDDPDFDDFGWFELTLLGNKVLNQVQKSSSI